MSTKSTCAFVLFFCLVTSCSGTSDVCPKVCSCTQKPSGLDINCNDKGLTEVPAAVKSITGKIGKLGLASNKIKSLDDDEFGTISCKDIVLSSNRDIIINKHAFRGVRDLENIVLSQSNLKAFPIDIFTDVPTLKRVYLQDNPGLQSVAPTALGVVKQAFSLEEIDLSGCGVTNVSLADPCLWSKTMIKLTDNPVHCDCNLYTLIKSSTLKFEGECKTPVQYAGWSLSLPGQSDKGNFGTNGSSVCRFCREAKFNCQNNEVWMGGHWYKSSEYERNLCSKSPVDFSKIHVYPLVFISVVAWFFV